MTESRTIYFKESGGDAYVSHPCGEWRRVKSACSDAEGAVLEVEVAGAHDLWVPKQYCEWLGTTDEE
ncbi:MAG: hypothetical protein ABEN55_04030 [Bradymonadaceae bacterium]